MWWTHPGATTLNLVLSIALGLPILGAAVCFLFKYRALVVFAEEGRLVTVEGFFRSRRSRSRGFDEVREVRLRYDLRDEADLGSRHIVDLLFRDGTIFVIEEGSLNADRERVVALANLFGAPGYEGEKRIVDPRPGQARPI